MLSTWIEAAVKGRHGGPVRAGMWSSVVIGTHPIGPGQEVWLEIQVNQLDLGQLPAFWLENKGPNSFWHVPIPPQAASVQLHYRAGVRTQSGEIAHSRYHQAIVRPNLPDRSESPDLISPESEALVGNRRMSVRVDGRGTTIDVHYPSVGLTSQVRPTEGDQPMSRTNFRAIVGGLAIGHRLDWFCERLRWGAKQSYQGATNLLSTELRWRQGPFRVQVADFVVKGPNLPQTTDGRVSAGQYLKRFRIFNDSGQDTRALFGVCVQAEVNGGVGDPGLIWLDSDRALLASNRGHAHVNRKLARNATLEFAIALDDNGPAQCEPTGPDEAILLRWLDLPANNSAQVDLLVSGAFTGWIGDTGTFAHQLRPALEWFRAANLDEIEDQTAQEWDQFVDGLPELNYPRPRASYAVRLRRSALAAALHADEEHGSIASGLDRGLNAFCYPRDAIAAAMTLDRVGHDSVGRGLYQWLAKCQDKPHSFNYWFQKYSMDGVPEWETPAVDHSSMIPWGLERHYRRTGDLDFVKDHWRMIEQAAKVCFGVSGHPGLCWLEDLSLISSCGMLERRFGASLHSNVSVVAGLRAAARLAEAIDHPEQAELWSARADRIWFRGILGQSDPNASAGNGDGGSSANANAPHEGEGLIDPESGRFLDCRRLSMLPGLWTQRPELLRDRSAEISIGLLCPAVPYNLLSASHPALLRSAEAILKHNAVPGEKYALARWRSDPGHPDGERSPGRTFDAELSSLATLWMARYLIRLGRETGENKYWEEALGFLDGMILRLDPLGVRLRPPHRFSEDGGAPIRLDQGVWGLHAILINTILDWADMEYDAVDRVLTIQPSLPLAWPHVGLKRTLRCGEAEFSLERPVGSSSYRFRLSANLNRPIQLDVRASCAGMTSLGAWRGGLDSPAVETPKFSAANGSIAWTARLPAGSSVREWRWGEPHPFNHETEGDPSTSRETGRLLHNAAN